MRETSAWLTNFISDRTRATYKKAIEEFATFAELESPDDLYDVDSTTVLAWREHLISLELSNNSVANRLSALSSLFRHLCDKQIVQTNPVQGIKRPKTPQQGVTPSIANKLVRKILDDAADRIVDAKTATAALTAARNSAILHVLFFLGPRVSEVVALNVGDIVADGEYTVMKLTVKGGQAHRVPAPPEALAAVNEYLSMSGHKKGAMFRRIKGGNGRLTRLSIYNIFTQAAKRSTTHHFSTHSARATFATESLENGSLLEHVQAALGHANITTTQMYDRRKTLHRDSPTLRVRYG
jgi:site-specific recombinase XerD